MTTPEAFIAGRKKEANAYRQEQLQALVARSFFKALGPEAKAQARQLFGQAFDFAAIGVLLFNSGSEYDTFTAVKAALPHVLNKADSLVDMSSSFLAFAVDPRTYSIYAVDTYDRRYSVAPEAPAAVPGFRAICRGTGTVVWQVRPLATFIADTLGSD